VRVVGLGAWCEYVSEDRRGASFRVQEFAVLADGPRLTLSNDRGFSSSTSHGDHWASLTLEHLEADVPTTVVPDEDDTGEEHPWAWLADRLRTHGVDVSPEELKQLPYEVVFSERLRDRLSARP
jgi:hypothetical protein